MRLSRRLLHVATTLASATYKQNQALAGVNPRRNNTGERDPKNGLRLPRRLIHVAATLAVAVAAAVAVLCSAVAVAVAVAVVSAELAAGSEAGIPGRLATAPTATATATKKKKEKKKRKRSAPELETTGSFCHRTDARLAPVVI